MGNFWLFQQARCEVIVKYTNFNLLEHKCIGTGIRTLEAQTDKKKKNIEAQQNVTLIKRRVYGDKTSLFNKLLEKDNSFLTHNKNLQALATGMYKIFNNMSPAICNNSFARRVTH